MKLDGVLPAILAALLTLSGCAQPTRPQHVAAPPPATDRQLLMMLPQKALAHYSPAPGQTLGYGQSSPGSAAMRTAKAIARQYGLELLDDWPMPALELHCFVVALPADASVEVVLDQLGHDERVQWAQPMHLYRTLGHNDPYYARSQPNARPEAHWHAAPRERQDARGAALDVQASPAVPYMNNGYPQDWIQTLNALEKYDFEGVIRGHGEVVPKAHLAFFRSYISDLVAAVKQAAADGATLDEMKRQLADDLAAKYEKGMSKYPLGQYRDRIGLNVEMVYQKLIAKG